MLISELWFVSIGKRAMQVMSANMLCGSAIREKQCSYQSAIHGKRMMTKRLLLSY